MGRQLYFSIKHRAGTSLVIATKPYVALPMLNTAATVAYLGDGLFGPAPHVWLSFVLSLLASISAYYLLVRLAPSRKALALLVVGVVSLLLILLHVVQFGYYSVFRDLISATTLDYIRQNPVGGLAHFRENFSLLHALVLLLGWVCCSAYLFHGVSTTEHKRPTPAKLALCLAPWILLPIVGRWPYLGLDQYALATLARSVRGTGRTSVSFVPRRTQLPALTPRVRANILFIRLEAIYRDAHQIYRPDLPTAPYWSRYAAQHPDEIFVASRHFANSSATDVAVMLLFTGAAADQSIDVHRSTPLLWDYAKAAGNSTSAFLPYDLAWGDFATRFQSLPGRINLDTCLHRGNAGLPAAYDNSINDSDVVAAAIAHQRQRQWRGPFFQLVSLKLPHFLGQGVAINDYERLTAGIECNERLHNYYEAIYRDDALMGKLHEAMPPEVRARTVVVAVSDHGNDVYGRGARLENYHEEIALVPCWFVIPKAVQSQLPPGSIEALRNNLHGLATSNEDIVPTLLDLLGVADEPAVARSLQVLPGRSLLRPQEPTELILMLNTNDMRRWDREGFALTLENGKKRFVFDCGECMFFDLEADPREQVNLYATDSFAPYRNRIVTAVQARPHLRRIVSKYGVEL